MSTDQNSSKCSPPFAGRSEVVDFQNSPFPTHDPFVLRKVLVLLVAFPAAVVGFLGESLFVGLSLYFVFVTIADLVSHFVLKLKPSRHADPDKLMLSERVTPEQFDAYFYTRCWIRCGGLLAACIAGGIAFLLVPHFFLQTFCSVYVLSTFAGILWVRFFLRIPRPKLFHRDDRYLFPVRSTAGCTTAEQWAASRIGWKTSGPFVG